jgi:hypothetical protein
MEAMRQSWTDDRLDDLNGKVDPLRLEMKTEFAAVRGEMDKRFDKMESRFDKMDERIFTMQKLMIQGGISMFGAMLVGFLTVLATTL